MTLISNVNLAGDPVTIPVGLNLREWYDSMEPSLITIIGFRNAISTRQVKLLSVDGGNDGHALFSAGGTSARAIFASEALTLTLAANKTLLSETRYVFAFQVQNPAAQQAAPAISIQAEGTAQVELERIAAPHLPVIGVLNGSDPMLVEEPAFDLKHIAQSMPLAFYRNIFTVTLQSNVNLAATADSRHGTSPSIISMTGLQYAIGPASISLGTTEDGNNGHELFSDGLFYNGSLVPKTASFINGTVTLYLHNQTMLAHTPYVITFMLTNPDSRILPSDRVHADRVGGAAGFVPPAIMYVGAVGTATILERLMVYPNQPLLGIVDGSNPLVLMYEPKWYYAEVSQSNPLALEPNNVTIRFSTNIDLRGSDEAVITVSGLTNAQGGSWIPLVGGSTANASDLFWDGKSEGRAQFNNVTNASVQLHVRPNATLFGLVDHVVSFQVQNPAFDQDPQVLHIEAGGANRDIIFIEMPRIRLTQGKSPSKLALANPTKTTAFTLGASPACHVLASL